MIVVDCSVAAAWALADESEQWTRSARAAVERAGMVVPWIFWFEIRNTLVVNERRGRIDAADADRFLRELPKLIADIDDDPDGPTVIALARSHQISVYDAAYLELAARRNLALCTLDQQLMAAAGKFAVELWRT
jgi:predicted nucleic acid-binding protein